MNSTDLVLLERRLAEKHFVDTVSLFRPAEMVVTVEDALNDKDETTIWQLLLKLLVVFVENYWSGGKFSFKFWEIKKHARMIDTLIKFFKQLLKLIKK